MQTTRNDKRKHRTRRIRAKVSGTAVRPRVNVYRSLTNFSVQLIDDVAGKTLLSGSISGMKGANSVAGAGALGSDFAQKCTAADIQNVVFDRGGYKYHGKVKAFADALREGGVKF